MKNENGANLLIEGLITQQNKSCMNSMHDASSNMRRSSHLLHMHKSELPFGKWSFASRHQIGICHAGSMRNLCGIYEGCMRECRMSCSPMLVSHKFGVFTRLRSKPWDFVTHASMAMKMTAIITSVVRCCKTTNFTRKKIYKKK